MDTSPQPAPERPVWSGAAVLGLAAVVLGTMLIAVPAVSGVLGAIALVLGLQSRGRLRADAALRGAVPSAIAFFGGIILIVIGVLPLVLSLVFALV
ncbi:hypothetical protein [Leifsonia poae]|uniref:DUF4190 domain-containing protein n=1 Tax=Leifsonia poae TaxID=110933 RepID=A0A9W6H8V7_9MICO|nr:hypothetical protein [Leifsonia poae]GLJ76070.1 hypothetical protein GCM10017584_16440 [Leifsonia poae]